MIFCPRRVTALGEEWPLVKSRHGAADKMSMSEAVRRLDALVARWRAVAGPAATARLNPPASDADLAAMEGALGFPVPEELVALWRWHDGQGPGTLPRDYVLGDLVLLSIADSIARRRIWFDIGLEVDGLEVFNESWIPFAAMGNADICLDARYGSIRQVDKYGPGGALESFDAWVDLRQRAFDAGLISLDMDDGERRRLLELFTRDEQDFV